MFLYNLSYTPTYICNPQEKYNCIAVPVVLITATTTKLMFLQSTDFKSCKCMWQSFPKGKKKHLFFLLPLGRTTGTHKESTLFLKERAFYFVELLRCCRCQSHSI